MQVGSIVSELEEKMSLGSDIDYLQMNTALGIIFRIVPFVLGIFVVLISILMPIMIILELIYINLPVFRTPVNKILNIKGHGNTVKAVKFIMGDAIKALEEANTVKTGKSATLIYLRIKIKWILASTVILVLVLDGSGIIIGTIYNIMSGIIEMIINAVN